MYSICQVDGERKRGQLRRRLTRMQAAQSEYVCLVVTILTVTDLVRNERSDPLPSSSFNSSPPPLAPPPLSLFPHYMYSIRRVDMKDQSVPHLPT